MNEEGATRGGAAVGLVGDLQALEASAVLYLRLWSDGPVGQTRGACALMDALGDRPGRAAAEQISTLIELCARYGRRPLMRHHVSCRCLGADEACFAHFVAAAAEGEHEDATLLATLLVRPDAAPMLVDLARDVGLAMRRLALRVAREVEAAESKSIIH